MKNENTFYGKTVKQARRAFDRTRLRLMITAYLSVLSKCYEPVLISGLLQRTLMGLNILVTEGVCKIILEVNMHALVEADEECGRGGETEVYVR